MRDTFTGKGPLYVLALLGVLAAIVVGCAAIAAVPAAAAQAQAGAELAAAISVANAVYPGVPQRCGTVKIEYGPLSPPNDTSGAVAEAYEPECTVRIVPGIAATYSDAKLCSLLTHEWGHLAARRFPENASDPHHSPNPHDNMWGRWLVHHPACGESDDVRAARQARERGAAVAAAESRDLRRSDIKDELTQLTAEVRAPRAAKGRARGARRARYSRRIRRLRLRIRLLRAEHRALAPTAVL